MIFHENRLLADDSHEISYFFCQKLEKMSQKGGGSVAVDSLFYVPQIVLGFLCLFLFCYALLCVLSSFAIIRMRKRELVALI